MGPGIDSDKTPDSFVLETPVDILTLPKDVVIQVSDLKTLVVCIFKSRGLADRIGLSDVRVRLRYEKGVFRPIHLIQANPFYLPFPGEGTQDNGLNAVYTPKNDSGMYEFTIKSDPVLLNWGFPYSLKSYRDTDTLPKPGEPVHTGIDGLNSILDKLRVYGRTKKGSIQTSYYSAESNYERLEKSVQPLVHGKGTDNLPEIRDVNPYSISTTPGFCRPRQHLALSISPDFQFERYFDLVEKPTDEDELRAAFLSGKAVGPLNYIEMNKLFDSFRAHKGKLFEFRKTPGQQGWPITIYTVDNSIEAKPVIISKDYLLDLYEVPQITSNVPQGLHRITRDEISNPIKPITTLLQTLRRVDYYYQTKPRDSGVWGNWTFIIALNFDPFSK